MRLILAFVLVGVLAAPALATLSEFTYQGEGLVRSGNSLYIIPDTPVTGTLSFKGTSDMSSVVVNFSGLDARGTIYTPNQVNPSNNCPGLVCTFNVVYYAKSGTNNQLSWTWATIGANPTRVNVPILFDNVAPRFEAIGTPTCKNNCAVRSGMPMIVIAYFVEQGIGMDAATVRLEGPFGSQPPEMCGINNCTFIVTIPNGASPVALSINEDASDKAGNKIAAGNRETNLRVDNDAPVIGAITVQQAGSQVPIVTGAFTLRVAVTDASSIVATVDASELTGNATPIKMQCSGGTCTAQINPKVMTQTRSITVRVVDAAGNEATSSRNVQVARTTAQVPGEFWSAEGEISPRNFNPNTAALFNTRLTMKVTLTGNDDAKIAFVKAGQCKFIQGGRNLPITLNPTTPNIVGASSETPVLMLNMRSTGETLRDVTGTVRVECEILVHSYKNDLLYQTPQRINVTSFLTVKDDPLLPQKFDEIKKKEQEKQQRIEGWVNTLGKAYSIGAAGCTAISVVQGTSAALTGVQSIIGFIPILGEGAGNALRGQVKALDGTVRNLQNSKLGTLCSIMTCEYANDLPWSGIVETVTLSKTTNAIRVGPREQIWTTVSATETDSDFVQTQELSYGTRTRGLGDEVARFAYGNEGATAQSLINPYTSWPVAVATLCAPAMINHLQTYSSIQCRYNQCLNQDVPAGLPISVCQAEKDHATCRFVRGGIVSSFAPVAAYESLRNTAITAVTKPAFLAGVVLGQLNCDSIPASGPHGICKLPSAISGATATLQTVQRVRGIADSFRNRVDCSVDETLVDPFYNLPGANAYCTFSYCTSNNYMKRGNECFNTAGGTLTSINCNNIPRSDQQRLNAGLEESQRVQSAYNQNTGALSQEAIDRLREIEQNRARLNNPSTYTLPSAPSSGASATGNVVAGSAPIQINNPTTAVSASSGNSLLSGFSVLETSTTPVSSSTCVVSATSYASRSFCASHARDSDKHSRCVAGYVRDRCKETVRLEVANQPLLDCNLQTAGVNSNCLLNGVLMAPAPINEYLNYRSVPTCAQSTSTGGVCKLPNGNLLVSARDPISPVISQGSSATNSNTAAQTTSIGTGTGTAANAPAQQSPNQQGTQPSQTTNLPRCDSNNYASRCIEFDGSEYNPGVQATQTDNNQLRSNALGAYDRIYGTPDAPSGTGDAESSVSPFDLERVTAYLSRRQAFEASVDRILSDNSLSGQQKSERIQLLLNQERDVASEIDNREEQEIQSTLRLPPTTRQRAIRSIGMGLTLSAQVDVLSSFIGPLKRATYWKEGWAETVDDKTPSVARALTDAFCKMPIEREPQTIGAVNADGRSGLALIARRSNSFSQDLKELLDLLREDDLSEFGIEIPQFDDFAEPKYQYLIHGRMIIIEEVITPDEATVPFERYTVSLRGASGKLVLQDSEFVVGRPVQWSGNSALKVEADEIYNEVCVEFQKPVRELFKETEKAGNEICLPITVN